MTLFRLDASIRTEGSHSREIADIVQREWRPTIPAPVVTREIGIEPLPAAAWAAAVGAAHDPEDQRSAEQLEAVALAKPRSTAWSTPTPCSSRSRSTTSASRSTSRPGSIWWSPTRAWPPAATPAIAGKPAVLATVRGGNYSAGTPREGWDHATGWMRRILEDVWQLDLRVVEGEFTLVGVNPASTSSPSSPRNFVPPPTTVQSSTGKPLAERVAERALRATQVPPTNNRK